MENYFRIIKDEKGSRKPKGAGWSISNLLNATHNLFPFCLFFIGERNNGTTH
jgi:hypothetical protein